MSGQFTPQWPDGLPVGDEWVPAPQQADIRFPYDGSLVASAPVGDAATAGRALDHAVALRETVGRLPSHVRRAALSGAHRALAERRTEVEQLLVLETGKPLVDCRTEVDRTLLTLQTSAEEVARLHGETVPLDLLPSGEGLIGFWVRKPVGVVVGIAGYNYPLLLAAHKVAPALAAGCPVIIKPAPQTPLATLWMVHVLREALVAAGGPAGAVQLVTGGVDVGVRLTTDPRLGAVSFTGSAAVGHQIARDAAPTKVLLELGSNAAVVVAEDADLDAAADAVIRGGYYASGQACISVQRVIVTEPVRDQLVKRLSRADRRGRRRRPPRPGHPGLGADRRAVDRPRAGLGRAGGRRRRPGAGWRDGAGRRARADGAARRARRLRRVGRGDLRPGRRRALGARPRRRVRGGQRLPLRPARQRLHGPRWTPRSPRSTGSTSVASSSTRCPGSVPTSCRTAAPRTPASGARDRGSRSRS